MTGERVRIGVLALQGDVREHVRMLTDAGAHAVPVRRPEELDDLDGIVLPGGESTTIAKLADRFALLEPLRRRMAEGLPAYGSCAGMVLLAESILDGADGQQTFGGLDVVVRRNAFGRQVDSFESQVEWAGETGRPVPAIFIRAPWVEKLGDGVEVLAQISGGPDDGRIVAVRSGHLVATSFHPELTGDARVHRYFVQLVESVKRGSDAATGSDLPRTERTADRGGFRGADSGGARGYDSSGARPGDSGGSRIGDSGGARAFDSGGSRP